jgi:hypothetical protein
MFLQQLWLHKLDWDTQLPTSLQEQWNQLLHVIPHLFHIKVPRKVICFDAINVQIHVFCDSSETAYGSCLYIRSMDGNEQICCKLLCSTSKVAPIKQLTIPRLEICAAVLLAKLFRRATSFLKTTVHDCYLWKDSSIVLTWIQGTSRHWKHLFEIELLSSKRQPLVQHGDTYHLHRTLLTSFHEELIQQHCLQLHYGGMDLDGSCMTHFNAHQEISSQQQKNWKSRKHLWQS